VECLAELAGPGPVLELGVGTGRVALPLVQRGLVVDGIDASPAMLAKLRAKPGGDRVRVTVGDMAEVGVDASYSLVFVVFNTLFALVSQDEQVRCFANVAGRLAEGGVFVVEAFVPDPGGGQAVRALMVTWAGCHWLAAVPSISSLRLAWPRAPPRSGRPVVPT